MLLSNFEETSCSLFFTPEELVLLDKATVPQHIAIIPDGNRRWAKKRGISSAEGYRYGAQIFFDIVKAAEELGVSTLTIYTFSTENWLRPQWEVQSLHWLLSSLLVDKRESMLEAGVRFETIGDLTRFPKRLQRIIAETKALTANCNTVNLVLALNYGGRDDLLRACKALIEDCEQGKITKEDLTEAVLSQRLDTARWPDPDLLIRTAGDYRISNFLLWQVSYAEINISNELWPDYTPRHLLEAILDFQKRERRGGI